MRYTGTLDGVAVHFDDTGYNPCVWFITDTPLRKQLRKAAQTQAFRDNAEEFSGEPIADRMKASWRQAYREVPTPRVPWDDVPRITYPGIDAGEIALAKALPKSI